MENNILTVIACHTNSNIKINALVHNIKYFMELSNTIVIINSLEFKSLNIEKMINDAYFSKNIILNDILTDDLCYNYREKYSDLSSMNNEELNQHWVNYGKEEKRNFSFPVYNIYFDYLKNDKFIAHGKWLFFFNKIHASNYTNFILTNDSFIISRSLFDLKLLIDKDTELVALLESDEMIHHYSDFLRVYNHNGLNKILKYIESNMSKITDFKSVIKIYEIDSSHIFNSVKILYKNIYKHRENIHFHNEYLVDYLYDKNYPIIKIKKILYHFYLNKNIPDDFNNVEYKNLNSDLVGMSDEDAMSHFKNYGVFEGRPYKNNQVKNIYPPLKTYLKLMGLNNILT